MLKPRIIATELRKKRTEEKAKKSSAPLNSADVTVIGNDLLGFRPSVLVNSEGNSYLFNCGSGTQRICFMSRIKLTRLENVFITNRTWENISGVFGLSLTLQDMGCPNLNVISTDAIAGLFDASRNFVNFTTGMVVSAKQAQEHTDSSITIKPIAIDPSGKRLDADDSKRAKLNSKLYAYLCTLPDLPGALDPQRCKDLKVPVGPLLGKLKSGQDVTLADGRVVKSMEVCSPKTRGQKFLIVDCPEIDQLGPFVSNDELRWMCKLDAESRIDFVIHLSPSRIVRSPAYQRWLQGFSDKCKHFLVSNTDPKVLNYVDCYRFQYLLNQLDDRIFPLLHLPENLRRKVSDELEKTEQQSLETPSSDCGDNIDEALEPTMRVVGKLDQLDKTTLINSFDKIAIRPKQVFETLDIENNLDILHKEAQLNPHYQEELDKLRKLQSSLPEAKDYEPELVFLGTGSAIPSKLRNTSCILLNFRGYPRDASVILDCGEDSYGQLLRHYGPNETARIMKQIEMIYISHHHTDHHVGMIDLLRQRRELTSRPITLLLPPNLDNVLRFHDETFRDLSDTYKIYRTKNIRRNPSLGPDVPTISGIKQTIYEDLDGLLKRIDVVAVDHCVNSCAAVFQFNINHPAMETFTVAYSGDARPSKDFVVIGKDCDLLIHEATFDDRSEEDAIVKKHCTSLEAIQMGRDMNAKFTILTHFSQRLPKIPFITEHFDDRIGFAFDNISLRCPTHFSRLPIMKPMFSMIFKKSLDEINLRYLKSELRAKALEMALKSK